MSAQDRNRMKHSTHTEQHEGEADARGNRVGPRTPSRKSGAGKKAGEGRFGPDAPPSAGGRRGVDRGRKHKPSANQVAAGKPERLHKILAQTGRLS